MNTAEQYWHDLYHEIVPDDDQYSVDQSSDFGEQYYYVEELEL